MICVAWSRSVIGEDEPARDLAALVVPQVGRLAAIGDRYEPYRLVDANGAAIVGVTAYFGDLLAAGRSESTVRSYGMDLLRWFRFIWAIDGVTWDRATRMEARDFSSWLQGTGKQTRPHWRNQGEAMVDTSGAAPVSEAQGDVKITRRLVDVSGSSRLGVCGPVVDHCGVWRVVTGSCH